MSSHLAAGLVDRPCNVASPAQALVQIWTTLGQPAEALARVTLTGAEPALPSSFAVGTLAQSTIAAAALSAAHIDTLRSGRRQTVSVDMRHAALEFRSERYFRVDGQLPPEPWAGRRGFDSLVQTASGFNWAEGDAAGESKPRPLPAQALDHAAGYLMAAGAMAALARRMVEGGGWHVRVSLAQTAHWLRNLGRIEHGLDAPDPRDKDLGAWLEAMPSGFGTLTALRHAGQLSDTPPHWTLPTVPLGADMPAWPPSR